MIFKDIAEWEVGDSELAQHTITNLHFEIDRLNKTINEIEKENRQLKKELHTLQISEEQWLEETLGSEKE